MNKKLERIDFIGLGNPTWNFYTAGHDQGFGFGCEWDAGTSLGYGDTEGDYPFCGNLLGYGYGCGLEFQQFFSQP